MDLHSPLRSVIPQYRDFLEIDAGTISDARRIWPVLEPELSGILQAFYDRTDAVEHLGNKTRGRRGPLISKQSRHWKLLLTGQLDTDYINSTITTALKHREIDLPFDWYINSYLVIGDMFRRALDNHSEVDRGTALAAHAAIYKLIAFDMAVASVAYNSALVD